MAVNIHITIIELNALHTKRQNLFQELDAVIHLLMEAKHWGLRKSRNATSLNSRFKSLDTLKVKIISVTFRRVIRTNHKKASKIWRHENLGYDATPFNQILKQNAKREMRLRLGKVTVADVLAAQPVTTNLLKFMRASIKMIGVSNLQSFIASMTQKLTLSDISDESKNYLDKAGITTACLRIKSKWTA